MHIPFGLHISGNNYTIFSQAVDLDTVIIVMNHKSQRLNSELNYVKINNALSNEYKHLN